MYLNFLKCKIHRASVTEANLDYEGSVAIDVELMEAAGILPFEQVDIYNINNGERFTTYAIEAPKGSKTIGIQGAAAHKATVGDLVIICSYCQLSKDEVADHKPKLVLVDEVNDIKEIH